VRLGWDHKNLGTGIQEGQLGPQPVLGSVHSEEKQIANGTRYFIEGPRSQATSGLNNFVARADAGTEGE
jgi:hypothetical protein